MTKQEMFDTGCTHLAQQKRRAYSNSMESCAYKAGNGDMCVVGCMFNDAEHKAAEGSEKTIIGLVLDPDVTLRPFFAKHVEFLRSLQVIHDCDERINAAAELRDDLHDLALYHQLNSVAAEQIEVWNG